MQHIVPHVENLGNELVVSSDNIAQGSEIEHRAVLQLIRKHIDKLERFGRVTFEMRPLQTAGGVQNTNVALLNEQQSTLLLTFTRNTEKVIDFKVNLVDKFYEMAQQLQEQPQHPPAELSRREILTMALEAEERADEYKAELEIAAPKADYVDNHVADNDYLLFRTVASNLEVGETDLRWALVYCGWIYHDSYRRRNSKGKIVTEHQWAEYSHKKTYFFRSMNHYAPLFKGNTYFTLKITVPGAAAITRLVKKIENEFGTLAKALPGLEERYNRKKAA